MGKYGAIAAQQQGRYSLLGEDAENAAVHDMNKGVPTIDVPRTLKMDAEGNVIGTEGGPTPLIPPRKPHRTTFSEYAAGVGERIYDAFVEPWQSPNMFLSEERLTEMQYGGPLPNLSAGLYRLASGSLKLLDSASSVVLQGVGEVINPERPTQARRHLEEITPAFIPGELGLAGGGPARVRAVEELPKQVRTPGGIEPIYSLDDIMNGKLKADVELDRQARASLNVLSADKSNIESVVDNYRFWMDQVDPGHVLYPSTDGAKGQGIVGFRTADGTDYAAAGTGTRSAAKPTKVYQERGIVGNIQLGNKVEDVHGADLPAILDANALPRTAGDRVLISVDGEWFDGTVLTSNLAKGTTYVKGSDGFIYESRFDAMADPSPNLIGKKTGFGMVDKTGSATTPSDATLYIPTKRAAALQQAQQKQAAKGNTSGLYYDLATKRLFFSIVGQDGKVIGQPRAVRTATEPKIGFVPAEVRIGEQPKAPLVPPKFTEAAGKMPQIQIGINKYGPPDATGLWFLDGDKPVYAWGSKSDPSMVLGNRGKDLDKYPSITKGGTKVWYKPGEEERAKQLADVMETGSSVFASGDKAAEAAYHYKVGILLGYPEANVRRYAFGPQKLDAQSIKLGAEITTLHETVLPSTRDKMLSGFRERAEAAQPGQIFPIIGQRGAAVSYMEQQRTALTEAARWTLKKAYNLVKRNIWDRSGAVRSALLSKAGAAGRDAVQKFTLSAGSAGRASIDFKAASDEIYGGLVQGRMPAEEKQILDDMLRARRAAQILSYDREHTILVPDTAAGVQRPATADDFAQALREIRQRVGPAKYLELEARASLFQDAMRTQLVKLRNAGIIGDAEFDRLSRFEYLPNEYIEALDPSEVLQFGKTTMSVRSSGIQSLGKGSEDILEMNSDTLLAQVIARVDGRIARNEATKALADVARVPENGIVSFSAKDASLGPKPVQVSYMAPEMDPLGTGVKAKRHTLWMNREYAQEWMNYRPDATGTMARVMGKISGADVVRTFATGINPAAGPFLFLMDAANAVTVSHMYSGFIPKAALELGADLWHALPDAFMRGRRFKEFAEDGGLMPFLVHGGRGHSLAKGPFASRHMTALGEFLGYWNESWELAMRLAIRERGLKQGMTRQQASFEARNWIDFSQGGHVTKAFDNVIPYLNAGIQGIRQYGREAKADPKKFAFRTAQVTAGFSGLYIYNMMRYPYVMEQIPDEEKGRFLLFPSDAYTLDAKGQKRYLYARVPIPPQLRWLKGVVDTSLDFALQGKKQSREMVQSLLDSFSVFGSPTQLTAPTANAAMEYISNYDFFTMRDVWTGPTGIPAEEEYNKLPDTPTSTLAIDIGRALGMSPERLANSFHSVVPRNLYTDAVDWSYRFAKTGEMLPEEAPFVEGPGADIYLARNFPLMNRIIGVTHPMANLYEKVQETAEPLAGEAFAKGRDLDAISMRYMQAFGQEKRGVMQEAQDLIRQAPDYLRQRLADRFKQTVIVDEVYQKYTAETDMPPKKFWTVVAAMAPEARAAVFYEQWATRSPEGKRSMIALAKRMPGFYSSDFGVLFNRIRKERGSSPEAD